VTATTPTSVTLAWNPSTDNSGNFSYEVRLGLFQTRTVPRTQTSVTWTGLQPGTSSSFRVRAIDAAGNQSAYSNTVSATTPTSAPPATPANLRVTATTTNSVSLAWDPVSNVVSYQVRRDTVSSLPVTQTSDTVNGLVPGTTYAFSVRALNSVGQSAWSAPLSAATVADTMAPTVPVLSGSVLSPSMVRLTWTESTDNLPMVGYNVYVNGLPARNMLPVETSPRTVEIHQLHAASTYQFTVKAYDQVGNFSAASHVLSLTTQTGTDSVPPAAPTNLRHGSSVGPSSVTLAWDGGADNVATVAFDVYVDGNLAGEVTPSVHYPGFFLPRFTVRHLAPGSTHTFTVKARDESGNRSPASAPLTVTLLSSTDTVPPSAPTNLTGSTDPNCAFLDLSWGASADNVDPSSVLEYEIYEDDLFLTVYAGEVVEGSFGRHTYAVKAVDRTGNTSGSSNIITLDPGLSC
jgi:chitodextrinase